MISEAYSMELCTRAPVLVTGGTGFIGGHIVAQLLARGYHVRTTVRNLENHKQQEFLRALPQAENLEIVEADLNNAESWAQAFEGGVEFVFHVASPHILRPENPQETLVNPAVNGTKAILDLCQSTASVKKLIFTSCIQTLCNEFDNSKEYSEESWNETASLVKNSYGYSKTMAEKEVWAFMERGDVSFAAVSIVAGVVLGPHLGGRVCQSHRFLLAFLEGKLKGIPNISLNLVDVRDIATAHLVGMENTQLTGRYCCCNKAVPLSVIFQTMHENFHDLLIPTRKLSDIAVRLFAVTEKSGRAEFALLNLGRSPRIKCTRAKEAGFSFRPSIQTVVDTCRYLIESRNIDTKDAGGRGCVVM